MLIEFSLTTIHYRFLLMVTFTGFNFSVGIETWFRTMYFCVLAIPLLNVWWRWASQRYCQQSNYLSRCANIPTASFDHLDSRLSKLGRKHLFCVHSSPRDKDLKWISTLVFSAIDWKVAKGRRVRENFTTSSTLCHLILSQETSYRSNQTLQDSFSTVIFTSRSWYNLFPIWRMFWFWAWFSK